MPKAQAVSPAPDGGYPGQNTAEGQSALLHLAGGTYNTALGWASLGFNVTGNFNTGVGAATLLNNTADENTATGAGALLSNTTGFQNTANGAFALFKNTTGNYNTATGFQALPANTIGTFNTANGAFALFSNTVGNNNTASGAGALSFSTTGANNTAIGYQALDNNTFGFDNTAIGYQALFSCANTVGNTAIGYQALLNNTAGGDNIALGDSAGSFLTTGSNNIDIGNNGVAGEANTIRIGDEAVQTATYIAGINGQTASGGVAVFVKADGNLGTVTSSARFKDDIKPMDKASEALLALKPVTFRYKKEIDPKGIPQFGLVAEEVEKVNPDLVVRDANGKPQTVRYEQVNAMLLNEFLKQHQTVQELKVYCCKAGSDDCCTEINRSTAAKGY